MSNKQPGDDWAKVTGEADPTTTAKPTDDRTIKAPSAVDPTVKTTRGAQVHSKTPRPGRPGAAQQHRGAGAAAAGAKEGAPHKGQRPSGAPQGKPAPAAGGDKPKPAAPAAPQPGKPAPAGGTERPKPATPATPAAPATGTVRPTPAASAKETGKPKAAAQGTPATQAKPDAQAAKPEAPRSPFAPPGAGGTPGSAPNFTPPSGSSPVSAAQVPEAEAGPSAAKKLLGKLSGLTATFSAKTASGKADETPTQVVPAVPDEAGKAPEQVTKASPSSPATTASSPATTAVMPAPAAASASAAGASASASTARTSAPGGRRTRKARLRLTRIDPWSVMKTSLLFSVAFGIMAWVATYVLWSVILASGLFDSLNNILNTALSNPENPTSFRLQDIITTQRVLGYAALFGVLNVVIMTALATLFSFLYNLSATVLGGLEVTLAED